MHRNDLPGMFNQMGLTSIGVEVGVDRGDYAKVILERWPGKLVLVDPWFSVYLDMDGPDRLKAAQTQLQHFSTRLQWVQHPSTVAAAQFAKESLDWVYLDGDMGYASILSDLFAWYPKLKVGGVMCGHDYMDSAFADVHWPMTLEEIRPANDISEISTCGVMSGVRDFRTYSKITGPLNETKDGWPPNFWWVK